ncbi:MAG TPA: hypothetical protein VGC27_04580 [Rhizomicrobium sp.]
MRKIAVSCAIGVGAGLALASAYLGAPYAGVYLTPAAVIVSAAVVAFGSSIALLTFAGLSKPKTEKEKSKLKFSDLGPLDYAFFPPRDTDAAPIIGPDTDIHKLAIVQNPSAYADKELMLIFKKGSFSKIGVHPIVVTEKESMLGWMKSFSRKADFNPTDIRNLFMVLKDCKKLNHILLVNEHDEYIGYIPHEAVWDLTHENPESNIVEYIVDVLKNPNKSGLLRALGGSSVEDYVFDTMLLSEGLEKLQERFASGLVVLKGNRNRKAIGVIYGHGLMTVMLKGPAKKPETPVLAEPAAPDNARAL